MLTRVVGLLWIVAAVIDFSIVVPATRRFVGAQSATNYDSADVDRPQVICSPNSTNTPTQCKVRFNETLVLSCPTPSNWVKASQNDSSICETSVCTVNTERDLTYVDSGLYLCKNTTYLQHGHKPVHFFKLNVTVLTPPRLTNRLAFCEEEVCVAPWVPFALDIFNITVSYAGEGPFWVEWYWNDTLLNCVDNCSMIITNNRQTLLLSPSVTPQNWNGVFLAVVHNDLGSNTSRFEAYFDCNIIPIPSPKSVEKTELRKTEGESLNYSCKMSAPNNLKMLACFTRNKNQLFNQILNNWEEYCVISSFIEQLNHSNITVHRTNTPCPDPIVMVNFTKKQLTLNDSGIIYCAFVLNGKSHLIAQLNLTVDSASNVCSTTNVLVCAVPSSGGSVLVIVVVVVVLITVVVWRWKRKKRPSTPRNEERRPLVSPEVPVSPPLIVVNSAYPNRRLPDCDNISYGGNTPRPSSSFDGFNDDCSIVSVYDV